MEGRTTLLRSKRNRVELGFFPGTGWGIKKDFGENREGFSRELAMVRLLAEAGVPVAEVLKAEEPVILYRQLEGPTLADLLEAAEGDPSLRGELERGIKALARWLAGYYAASGGLALGDAHLRNFLLPPGGELAGVDFETCRPGPPEEDVARLSVFTLTYDPALTPLKRRSCALLLGECRRRLPLDRDALSRQIEAELDGLCARRGKDAAWREAVLAAMEALGQGADPS